MSMRIRSRSSQSYKYLKSIIPLLLVLTACTADGAKEDYDALMNSARRAATAGENPKAEDYFKAAIADAEKRGDSKARVTSLLAFADYYRRVDKITKCRDTFDLALLICERELKANPNESEWHQLAAKTAMHQANEYRDGGVFIPATAGYELALKFCQSDTTGGCRELQQKVENEYEYMKANRNKSDGKFDDVIASGKTNFQQDSTKQDANQKKWIECDKLEINGPISGKTEAQLIDLFEHTKSLYDAREAKYRAAQEKLVNYYVRSAQFEKVKALLETDMRSFLDLEQMSSADIELEPDKGVDANILSNDLKYLADVELTQGNTRKALELIRRALKLRKRWGVPDFEEIAMHMRAADIYSRLRHHEEAMKQADEALDAVEYVEKKFKRQFWDQRITVMIVMAALERTQGSFREAAAHLEEAHEAYSQVPAVQADLICAILSEEGELAKTMGDQGKYRKAIVEQVAFFDKHPNFESWRRWGAYERAGQYYRYNYDFSKAREMLLKAYKIALEPKWKSFDMQIDSLQWLGNVEAIMNNQAEAERYYKQAIEQSLKRPLPNPAELINCKLNIANLHLQYGRIEEATPILDECVAIADKNIDLLFESKLVVLERQADVKVWQGDSPGALKLAREGMRILHKHKDRHDLIVRTLNRIAMAELSNGNIKLARAFAEKSIALYESSSFYDQWALYSPHQTIAHTYFLAGDDKRWKHWTEKSRAILNKIGFQPRYSMWDWDFDASCRQNRPPHAYPVSPEDFLKSAQSRADFIKNVPNYWPANHILYAAEICFWSGYPKEGEAIKKLSAQLRDTQMQKKPVY